MCNAVTIIESRKKTSTTATGRRETELRERERAREVEAMEIKKNIYTKNVRAR